MKIKYPPMSWSRSEAEVTFCLIRRMEWRKKRKSEICMKFKTVLMKVNTKSIKTMILKQKVSRKKKGKIMVLKMKNGKMRNSIVTKRVSKLQSRMRNRNQLL